MNFADELYLFNLTSYFKTKPLGSNSAAIRNAQHCNLRAALNRYSSTFYSSNSKSRPYSRYSLPRMYFPFSSMYLHIFGCFSHFSLSTIDSKGELAPFRINRDFVDNPFSHFIESPKWYIIYHKADYSHA